MADQGNVVSAAAGRQRVEQAKRLAESCWLLEHARACANVAPVQSVLSELVQNDACGVAGCRRARELLGAAAAKSGDVDGDAAANARALLGHRSKCAWARPDDRGKQRAAEPCLVCVLVNRARPVRSRGGVRLDFSQRHESANFDGPAAPAADAPQLDQACSTEEVALLLSHLSGERDSPASSPTVKAARAATRRPSTLADVVQVHRHNTRTRASKTEPGPAARGADPDAPKAPKREARVTCHEENDAAAADDFAPTPPDSPDASPVRPAVQPAKKRPPAAAAAAGAAHTKRLAVAKHRLARNGGPASPRALSPRPDNACGRDTPRNIVPRSPSFSAAASSLLALTGVLEIRLY
ncbi:hypothetical protein M885DRAFT_509442 [Pelagophyceae sp. CCMP2097]|nr:hypothetical protein M885DRAFT_509442 [Pelagophyceae sp. CCMP2097]